MLRWFRAFLPKEERFFDLFARHSQTVVQGALALQGMLRGGAGDPDQNSKLGCKAPHLQRMRGEVARGP